jgi:hypothetical protein
LGTTPLGSTSVGFVGQVNAYAKISVQQISGSSSLVWTDSTDAVINFGTVQQGSSLVSAAIKVGNGASGVADALDVAFSGNAGAWNISGNTPLTGLNSGDFGTINLSFTPTVDGTYLGNLLIDGTGSNASGYRGSVDPINVSFSVTTVSAVPEPAEVGVIMGGVAFLGVIALRRKRTTAPAA